MHEFYSMQNFMPQCRHTLEFLYQQYEHLGNTTLFWNHF